MDEMMNSPTESYTYGGRQIDQRWTLFSKMDGNQKLCQCYIEKTKNIHGIHRHFRLRCSAPSVDAPRDTHGDSATGYPRSMRH